jgi:hypothetical protein
MLLPRKSPSDAGNWMVRWIKYFDSAGGYSVGGYKESGWGREMSEEVLDNDWETKAVTTAL